ncbi:hypothetical protein VP01_679g9 [Puccinia sorghi]|uniref:Uncharacterized protein n=1 Tax=Puccinia sorghi TaxID=27349 RepID=A0A0L6UEJ8_9BASI|nr:hypothetical protein VP01_679g9 [Puccinia sorghi]
MSEHRALGVEVTGSLLSVSSWYVFVENTPLQHSPKGSATKLPADELEPEPPKDGVSYSKEEIAEMCGEERQWLTRRQHLIKGEDLNLIDYEEDTI